MHEHFRTYQISENQEGFARWDVVVGWVARTRPLAEPLSPRGPQPIV